MMRNFYERRRVSSDMKEKQQRYEALVHAFHADIFRYAFYLIQDKSIAEDVVQETFLRAWRSLDALKDEKAAKAWLITIVRRENARRFEKKQFDTVDIDANPVADEVIFTETSLQEADMQRLLCMLSESYREPLILQLLFGYSGEEIAAQLNLNKNTVMTRLFRARSQLKELLSKQTSEKGRHNG
ncbi:sigma-70 family RNA polymerase sigma factor [Salinimonas iocasae]|uniref:RNA polymerase sigma factor n=1 Tax=Salinimonas iocasae TaxID=2572577 RepID=A0A5B7YEV3_9ALTE|nr:sigma-70 family RNA polymerase sigma factor [Salinimonas iocasae]QCZ94115.1 sigma-70 family RNA polymerase sigma factor [Salinimonas iocasae]